MKMSVNELQVCINRAFNMSIQNNLRFGQALWNELPAYLTDGLVGTDNDFLQWSDAEIEIIL